MKKIPVSVELMYNPTWKPSSRSNSSKTYPISLDFNDTNSTESAFNLAEEFEKRFRNDLLFTESEIYPLSEISSVGQRLIMKNGKEPQVIRLLNRKGSAMPPKIKDFNDLIPYIDD